MLTELLDWRWMFLYNVPVGIIIFVLGYLFLDLKKRDKTLLSKIDYIGILLLATSLIALLIFLEEGDRRDWFSSNFIILCFTIFSLCLVFFIKHELTIKNPVIELNIFIKKNFFIGSIICIIFAINLYPPIFLIPVLITKMHNIDPIDIGLIVSTMGVGMMITGPIAGRLLAIYGVKTIVILGSFITGLATYLQSYITADYVVYDFLPSQLLKGIGTQLIFMGSQYICLSKLHTNKVPNAAAMYNLILRLTAGVSIAVSSNYFIKFKKQFFSQISKNYSIETLTLNAIEKDQIDSKFLDNLLLLYERESFIMAFNKISYLSFYTSLVPLILLLTIAIKKNYPTKGTS